MTFVLIPGAGTDPRVWDATIAALRDLGHDAIAPALPLDDQTAGPTAHADAVAGAVVGRSGLVVVAQSLGAFAGPLVAARADVAQLVLLAPMIPRPGETAVIARIERLSGQPGAGMFTEPWPLRAWPDVPTRVLAPREDRLFPLEFQRRVARERLGLEVDEMNGGHLPMLARPAELAARLVELAAERRL